MTAFIMHFFSGFGSAFDMSAAVYDTPLFLRHRTDEDALKSDWETLCGDGQKAVSTFAVTFEAHLKEPRHA